MEMGLSAARTTMSSPLLMPASMPPARLVARSHLRSSHCAGGEQRVVDLGARLVGVLERRADLDALHCVDAEE